MALILIYLGGVAAAGAIWYLNRRRQPARARSTSFNSEVMLRGVFPQSTKGKEPIINVLLFFKNCPSTDQMLEVCDKLLFYERYRSAATKFGSKWIFVDLGKDGINIHRDHLETIYAESEEDVKEIADQICATSIADNRGRPLWKLYRIINKDSSQPSMVLFRIHHSIGDGISLVGTIVNLFEDVNGERLNIDIPEKMGGQRESSSALSASKAVQFVSSAFEVLTLPNSRYDSDIAFTDPNKKKLVFSSSRKTIYFPTLKLSFIKQIKNRAGVTINDVLLSATAGAIRRYSILKGDPAFTTLSSRGQPKEAVSCRALIPLAFPRSKRDLNSSTKSLRNLWSFVSAPLPMKVPSLQHCILLVNDVLIRDYFYYVNVGGNKWGAVDGV